MKQGLKVQRRGMCCMSWALVLRELEKGEENGLIIGEDIPFGNGEGMHIARIESPAAGYALYLLPWNTGG
jgi:hypothetical protein